MHVKLCPECGYQLARKAKRCHWCKSPVREKSAHFNYVIVFLIFLVSVVWIKKNDNALVSPLSKPTQTQEGKVITTNPSIKKSWGEYSTILVKARVLNLRKGPSLTSHTIKKLQKGQRLTQVGRSGNWLRVLEAGTEDKLGWVHASVVEKINPLIISTHPPGVKVIKSEPLIKKSSDGPSMITVRAQVINFRKNPSLESRTIKTLKKGQRLTQVSRSGSWIQVLEAGAEDKHGWVHSALVEKAKPPVTHFQPQGVHDIKNKPSIKKSTDGSPAIYVQGKTVSLREKPTYTAHSIKKLQKGQRLTQVGRSGDWLQVLADNTGGMPAWVHSSLVGKTKPSSFIKAPSEQKAFKMFQVSFENFNAEIKKSKGMTFFNDVEYLSQGMIQITASDILLSAPKKYQEKYLISLMEMWLDVRETDQPATIRIVDKDGHVQMEEKHS